MLGVKFRANAVLKFLLGGGAMLWLKYLKSEEEKKDCYYFRIKKAFLVIKRVCCVVYKLEKWKSYYYENPCRACLGIFY